MKKLLAVFLSLCLVIGMVPMLALADGTGDQPGQPPVAATANVAAIGEKQYETLEKAVTEAGDKAEITLLANVTLTDTLTISKPLTINGDGKMITGVNGKPVIEVTDKAVTLNNVTLTGGSVGLSVKGTGSVSVTKLTTDKNTECGIAVNGKDATLTVFSATLKEKFEILLLDNVDLNKVSSTDMFKAVSFDDNTGVVTSDPARLGEGIITNDAGVFVYSTLEKALASKQAENKTVNVLRSVSGGKYAVPKGVTLSIPANVELKGSLTNNGTVMNSGTITGGMMNYGVFTNNGKVTGDVANTGSVVNNGTINGKVTGNVPTGSGAITGNVPVGTKFLVTFKTVPANATVTVYDSKGAKVAFNGMSDQLLPGSYTYSVTAANYNGKTGSFKIEKSGLTINVALDIISSWHVNIDPIKHGKLTSSGDYVTEGDWVYITAKADVGYKLSGITVKMPSGYTVKVEKYRDNVYRFKMPGTKVNVSAEFIRVTTPFTDLALSNWFYEPVSYVYWNGIMNGVTASEFRPNETTTRAMAVTVLYRLAGSPKVSGTTTFKDVPANSWFANAVKWASDNGIVKGVSSTMFAPGNKVSREDFATILYRYAQYKHYSTSANDSLTIYTDRGSVSGYALNAMKWACAERILDGVGNNKLDPHGSATRAQLAAMIFRFSNRYVAK